MGINELKKSQLIYFIDTSNPRQMDVKTLFQTREMIVTFF
jgi:hypothetical protein